jgi:hypothetical protein
MNVIFRLIENLVVGLIVGIAISGTVVLTSYLIDPRHFIEGSILAAFMGLTSFLMVLRWWDESKGKFVHEIKALFVLCGVFCAFYTVISIIQYLIYHDELNLSPMAFLLSVLGIILYNDVQRNTKYHNWMKTNQSYKFPSYEPKQSNEERTVYYDEYGNYKGESWKSK